LTFFTLLPESEDKDSPTLLHFYPILKILIHDQCYIKQRTLILAIFYALLFLTVDNVIGVCIHSCVNSNNPPEILTNIN
jgi:hypothetical protein